MEERPPTSLHVRRAVRGDTASVSWLVGRFSPWLLTQARYRLSGTLRRYCEPEDVVQDVWVRALPRLGGLELNQERWTPVVLRYLSTTLLHRVKDLVQKHVSGKPQPVEDSQVDALVQGLSASVTGALTRVARNESNGALLRVLDELSEPDREIVVLRGIEGRRNVDVASQLGIEVDAASARYRRALERIRARLPVDVGDDLA